MDEVIRWHEHIGPWVITKEDDKYVARNIDGLRAHIKEDLDELITICAHDCGYRT